MGPTLSIKPVVNTQTISGIYMPISLQVTAGIATAFSMHYKQALVCGRWLCCRTHVVGETIPDQTTEPKLASTGTHSKESCL